MGEVRAFVAIKLDKQICRSLDGIVNNLRETHADVRWMHPENLHITLRFLGSVDEERIPDIETAITHCAIDFPAFDLRVNGVGVFPNPRFPRIVYAVVNDGAAEMKNISHALESRLLLLNFEPESRDFLPHITLGRVKSFKAKSLLIMKMREFLKNEIGSMTVRSLFLMKSELHPQGAIHTDLAEIKLLEGEGS